MYKKIPWVKNAAGFGADRRGTVAIVVAFGLVPVVLALGATVDIARMVVAQNTLARAADAAAIAGARAVAQQEIEDAAERYFDINFGAGLLGTSDTDIDVDFNPLNGEVTVVAETTIGASFMRLANVEDVPLAARAVAVREMTGIELALALDVTGSMQGSRIQSLKSAAGDLLDAIYGDREELEDAAIAIIPFSSRVNVGDDHEDWLSQAAPNKWSGCMQARDDEHALLDTPPSATWDDGEGGTDDTRFVGQPTRIGKKNYKNICPDEELLPLTRARSPLDSKINALKADGTTRIDMGLRWAWRAISPKWQGLWGDAEMPVEMSNDIHKVLVLMTDGDNVAQSYDEVSASGADDNVEDLCERIKDAGITLYTVTFRAPHSVKPMMRACATSEMHFFDSPSDGALRDSFARIGAQITKLRLVE